MRYVDILTVIILSRNCKNLNWRRKGVVVQSFKIAKSIFETLYKEAVAAC